PQNDVTLKMPAFEWVHVQLHQQKGMISLSPPTICNSAMTDTVTKQDNEYSPYEPFVNMIKAFYRMELTKVPQGKLTGKDNIF
ncbi:hypothetical protein Q5443_22995, partial [Escherichia coli]|nr:hypothetical protein [Escherichia coli]